MNDKQRKAAIIVASILGCGALFPATMVRATTRMTGRDMKLTIESMTYGADGLAHADNGKAVFVQGAVAGDTVEAEVVDDDDDKDNK